jgi:hypothetical protein
MSRYPGEAGSKRTNLTDDSGDPPGSITEAR